MMHPAARDAGPPRPDPRPPATHGAAMAGRTVFVTGAYGMVGGRIVALLLERGARVVVLRRDTVRGSLLVSEGLEERCVVVDGDLLAPGLVGRAIGEHECDTVFHLAAQTIVPTANRSPLATFETNVRGTWLLMEACRDQGVERVVVAASDKAYGASETLPYVEDQALAPRFPYDVSKACTDLIARSYWHTYGVPVGVTRLANVYGGGDLNRSRLVPEAVAAVLGGRSPVIRSDGSPERDFLYVDDAADAYLAVADALDADVGRDVAPRARGEAFNAGGDRPRRVLDVVAAICAAAGSDVEPDVRGAGVPAGEIDRQYVDSTRLRELTGWAPRVALEDGAERTLRWYREHPAALAP